MAHLKVADSNNKLVLFSPSRRNDFLSPSPSCCSQPLIRSSSLPDRERAMVQAMSSVFHALPSTLPRCLESTCSFRIAPPCLSTTTNTKWTPRTRDSMVAACVVSLKPDLSTSVDDHEEDQDGVAKIGARVWVTVSLKVYHAPKIPELDLKGMEGEIKDYVSLWKGKHLSANLPFKIQFVTEVGGRSVGFFAHLRDDKFELVQ